MEEAIRRIQQMNPVTREVNLENLQLVELPPLPEGVRNLYCSFNQLTSLPPLPSTLTFLSCGNNQLVSLPPLPSTLTYLACGNNQLVSLPPLPSTLSTLSCSNNQLVALPPLPESLTYLACHTNRLTSLPELPKNLKLLNCMSNKLVTLPRLPESLKDLIYMKNPFKEPLKTIFREFEKEHRNLDERERRFLLNRNLLYKIRTYQKLRNNKLEAAMKYKYKPEKIQALMNRNKINMDSAFTEEIWDKYFNKSGEVWTEGVGQAYGPFTERETKVYTNLWKGGKTRRRKSKKRKTHRKGK